MEIKEYTVSSIYLPEYTFKHLCRILRAMPCKKAEEALKSVQNSVSFDSIHVKITLTQVALSRLYTVLLDESTSPMKAELAEFLLHSWKRNLPG